MPRKEMLPLEDIVGLASKANCIKKINKENENTYLASYQDLVLMISKTGNTFFRCNLTVSLGDFFVARYLYQYEKDASEEATASGDEGVMTVYNILEEKYKEGSRKRGYGNYQNALQRAKKLINESKANA